MFVYDGNNGWIRVGVGGIVLVRGSGFYLL